jgi:hypothetical protein
LQKDIPFLGNFQMADKRSYSHPEKATLQVEALDSTLDMLGQNSKRALLFHLKESCDISLNPAGSFSLQQLNAALQQVLGASGATVILEHVILEMDRLADMHADEQSSRTTFH